MFLNFSLEWTLNFPPNTYFSFAIILTRRAIDASERVKRETDFFFQNFTKSRPFVYVLVRLRLFFRFSPYLLPLPSALPQNFLFLLLILSTVFCLFLFPLHISKNITLPPSTQISSFMPLPRGTLLFSKKCLFRRNSE